MDSNALERIIAGLMRSRSRLWTDRELAEELDAPLAEVQAVVNRLVGAGVVVQTGQNVRRITPADRGEANDGT